MRWFIAHIFCIISSDQTWVSQATADGWRLNTAGNMAILDTTHLSLQWIWICVYVYIYIHAIYILYAYYIHTIYPDYQEKSWSTNLLIQWPKILARPWNARMAQRWNLEGDPCPWMQSLGKPCHNGHPIYTSRDKASWHVVSLLTNMMRSKTWVVVFLSSKQYDVKHKMYFSFR
jgi:hypothetical protein